ncbi:MAG: hypothetical protein M3N52_08920 [Actinomycetota bacterium]|nr:hypothetical protein [Actinomycetota bacterium]
MPGRRPVAGATAGGDPAADSAQRDRTTVRRALRAGLVVWAICAGALLGAVLVAGAGGRFGLAAVLLGLTAGSLAASSWLLLSAALDLLAEQPPGRRRVAWTVTVVAFTVLSPVFVVGAQGR